MNLKTEISRKDFFKGSMLVATTVAFGGALSGFEKIAMAAEPFNSMDFLMDRTPFEPTKIFDDLYFVGSISVGQFVIKTSKGIIIIDSGWDENDADLLANSMLKLGLTPGEIKYILVTHAHQDHYGGAQALKEKYCPKAKIAMNIVDDRWLAIRPKEGPYDGVRPKIDIELTDGQQIKLGDITIQVVLTPGHTPGCMSMIVPVTDNGEHHKVAIWGGTGTPDNFDMNYLYLSSVKYFAEFTSKYKVDVEMSAHGWVDNSFKKMDRLRARKTGDPHPFVIGWEKYQEYEQGFIEMAESAIAKLPKRMPPKL